VLTRADSRGFSLVELMVALAAGLFILAGATFLYAEVVRANATVLRTAHLQQTLWSLASTMADDVRRAGYWSRAELALDGADANGFAPLHVVDGDCILYSYDEDGDDADGAPDPEDRHGFRLNDGQVQIKTSDASCGGGACDDCASGNWWFLTDPQAVRIGALTFSLAERALPVAGGARQLVAREIGISLEGALAADPAVRHGLATSVSVRNHELR
jgi:type IV pilus assembly protein PilW